MCERVDLCRVIFEATSKDHFVIVQVNEWESENERKGSTRRTHGTNNKKGEKGKEIEITVYTYGE